MTMMKVVHKVRVGEYDPAEFSQVAVASKPKDGLVTVVEVGSYEAGTLQFADGTEVVFDGELFDNEAFHSLEVVT